jgi:hypothetical protein
MSFNEGKACEAIVQCLEERANLSRAGLRWPEQEHHPFPIEAAFTIGDQLFAMEHTGIEPFKGHVKMNAEADRHFEPIIDALNDYLGWNSLFELIIPAKALQGRAMAEVRTIQHAIMDWFKETALTVPSRPFGDRRKQNPSIGPITIPGVPFAISLYRFEPTATSDHPLGIAHAVSNAEQWHIEPVRQAIERKFPKLAAWKRHENARTVLVLESNAFLSDRALIALIAQTFLPLAMARADRPDETYLVDSSRSPWLALPMLIDGGSFFDFMQSSDAQPSQFDPATLVPLTMR